MDGGCGAKSSMIDGPRDESRGPTNCDRRRKRKPDQTWRTFLSSREGGCGAVPRPRQLFPLYFNIGIHNVEYKFVIRIFRVREGARG